MPIGVMSAANPFLEYVSKGENPVKILISDSLQHCNVCGRKTHSLFILTFNLVACQLCFDFLLNCNYFNKVEEIELK